MTPARTCAKALVSSAGRALLWDFGVEERSCFLGERFLVSEVTLCRVQDAARATVYLGRFPCVKVLWNLS